MSVGKIPVKRLSCKYKRVSSVIADKSLGKIPLNELPLR